MGNYGCLNLRQSASLPPVIKGIRGMPTSAALGILFNKTQEDINKRLISSCCIDEQEEHTYFFNNFSGADIGAGMVPTELDFPVKYAQLRMVF